MIMDVLSRRSAEILETIESGDDASCCQCTAGIKSELLRYCSTTKHIRAFDTVLF